MRALLGILLAMSVSSGWAIEATVTDGDTLLLQGATFRLDGIEAPKPDQMCLNEAGALWPCGIAVRDRLREFVGKRDVRCDGDKYDTVYRNRRLGLCRVAGEEMSLNQWLVREGLALNLEPQSKGRFKADEDEARSAGKGLWQDCFVRPHSARRANKTTADLLGAACGKRRSAEIRNLLFPANPEMPAGCSIKGKSAVRAQFTGHRGIYHLETCRSYGRTRGPDRWFCSEAEAQAEGFRKAFTC